MLFRSQIARGFRIAELDLDAAADPRAALKQALDFEDLIPGSIVRAPLTAADQALGYTGGTVTQMSIRSVNFARREVEAVDIQADYTRKLSLGEVRVYAVADGEAAGAPAEEQARVATAIFTTISGIAAGLQTAG